MASPEVLSSFVKKRIEAKGSFLSFGRRRRRVRTIARLAHARLACVLALGVGRRRGGVCPAGARRQVERALAAATGERKRYHAQEKNGPPRRRWAQLTDHDDIPKSGRTIQRLPCHGE